MTELQQSKPLMHLLSKTFESLQQLSAEEISRNPLLRLRQQGLQTIAQRGLPTPRDEEWKYLNLAPFLQPKYQLPQQSDAPATLAIPTLPLATDFLAVFYNGFYQPQLSTIPPHLELISLRQMVRTLDRDGHPAFWTLFGSLLPPDTDPFVALNTALFEDGAFLHISTPLPQPVYLLAVSDSTTPLFLNLRYVINIEAKAAATIIVDHRVLQDSPAFHNTTIEIQLAEDAALHLIFLETDRSTNYGVITTRLSQAARSRSTIHTITAGNGMIRNTLGIQLREPEASTHLYGISVLRSNEIADHHTAVEHIAPSCTSSELYKSILGDNALNIFNGKIFVDREAQQTNAYQSNHNILLSDDARVYTKPQLEIFADDVRCTHGATVGQLPKDAIFYLRSRGIAESLADVLLLHAFAAETYDTLPDTMLRRRIDHHLTQRLAALVNMPTTAKLVDLQFATP